MLIAGDMLVPRLHVTTSTPAGEKAEYISAIIIAKVLQQIQHINVTK